MIHLLLVIDRQKSIGMELFNAQKYNFNSSLLIALVETILILSSEIDNAKPKGEIREIEIGDSQIGVIEKDNLAYVFIQDTYDNEPFTKVVMDSIIDEFHEYLMNQNFNFGIDKIDDVQKRIGELLTTMKFPDELLKNADNIIQDLLIKVPSIDTIFIADLDDGIIKLWQSGNDKIVEILMNILSEIPFERSWIGESKLLHGKPFGKRLMQYEGWIIQRIGFTDFCILARCNYNLEDRSEVISAFEDAANILQTEIFSKLEDVNY